MIIKKYQAGTETEAPKIRYFTRQGSQETSIEININDSVTEI